MPAQDTYAAPPALSRHSLVLAIAPLGVLAVGVLYFFDPAQWGFYPPCLFHKLTRLSCPGCGGLRALHQLTHGHWALALHLNPLLILSLPFLFWLLGRWIFSRGAGKPAPIAPAQALWPWILLSVVILFGVMRNLPFPPFTYLSP